MPSNPADETQIMPRPASVPPAPNPLARQLRRLKILAGLLFLALLGGLGGALYVRHAGQPVAVLLDGKSVTCIRNATTANALLAQAEQAKVGAGYSEDSIVRLQTVLLQHLSANSPIDPDNVALAKLKNSLRLHVHAFAILVNGKVSLGLPTDGLAADTIHLVKEHFAEMPPPEEIVGEPAIVEHIAIKQRAIDGSLARSSAADAAPYFWTPPPSRTYIVRRGDTGLAIARRNHVSLTDFITANAGRDINRLSPAQPSTSKRCLFCSPCASKKSSRGRKRYWRTSPKRMPVCARSPMP